MLVVNIYVAVPANVTLSRNTVGPVTYNDDPMPTPPAIYRAFALAEEVLALVPVTINLVVDKELSVVS